MASGECKGQRVLGLPRGRPKALGAREGLRRLAAIKQELGQCRLWMRSPRVALGRLAKAHDQFEELMYSGDIERGRCLSILLELSSLQIDAASVVQDADQINLGLTWAQEVMDSEDSAAEDRHLAAFNVANGLTDIHYMGWTKHRAQPATNASLKRAPFRLAERQTLRRTRSLNATAANSPHLDGRGRSTALCNLGNSLDESGRWVEAYQCYADALEADPTNGNAAGNAAELLRRRIIRGQGLLGHYGAVYDKYVRKAHELRDHTVAIAGEATARRWDALELTESPGHISHEGNAYNEYQQWIKEHRLALALAVEGMGSDEPRWDSASLGGIRVRAGEPDPPLIFSSMNVLKAEFLTVRRLAFHGETMLMDSLYSQHPEDTGSYADTLDYSLYGEPPAMLILAQRASLDLLDKIAVAANEHFRTGLNPDQISFRNYWFDRGSGAVRPKLPKPVDGHGMAIALAELSYDIGPEGLYPAAQTLRNAGTHRLVHLTHGHPTGVTEGTHSTVDYCDLIHACHESLRVARSAFIYLIDLIGEGELAHGSESLISLPLPNQI